jgi:hypothetical protein
MEPIRPREDFFFLSYINFKVKCTIDLSLQSIPQPPILDENMIELKSLPRNTDQPKTNPSPITYKRPRDKKTNTLAPPKIKYVYKVKENVVEQPFVFTFDLPSQEENKSMVDKLTPTPTQIEN